MGYETTFSGLLEITPKLKPEHFRYLEAFGGTRRMKRDPNLTMQMDDPLREAVGLPVGKDGGYFVGDTEGEGLNAFGQTRTTDIIDYNKHPSGQHGLWCGWSPTDDGEGYYAHDGKNYSYVEWLKYTIENFFERWGYQLNGEITWDGEETGDTGKIVVKNNVVRVLRAKISYEEE